MRKTVYAFFLFIFFGHDSFKIKKIYDDMKNIILFKVAILL